MRPRDVIGQRRLGSSAIAPVAPHRIVRGGSRNPNMVLPTDSYRVASAVSHLRYIEIFTCATIEAILNVYQVWARGFGGRHVPTRSPRQLKEVIPVAHSNVGSVATLGAMADGEVYC